jgi:hypothetical protein
MLRSNSNQWSILPLDFTARSLRDDSIEHD